MSPDDLLALDIAARHYRQPGAREAAALSELDMSPTRFWQRVNHLLDDPSILAADAQTVRRLRRLRSQRLRTRGH